MNTSTLHSLKQQWNNLKQRERLILEIGTISILLVAFYLFLWQPFTSHISNLRTRATHQQQLLTWMKTNKTAIKQLEEQRASQSLLNENMSLLTVIEQTLNKGNLTKYKYQLEQKTTNEINISFNNVTFSGLMFWLKNLWQKYEIEVKEISVNARQETDMVRANITLQK